jgi:catechol 2,3-dioxygenase-like lactoylglutathione lyase family enzyme
MAKVRHVAYIAEDTKKLRDFYHDGFGFEEVWVSPTGAYMVIDGMFNVTFIPQRPGDSEVVGTHRADGGEVNQTPGINHYGFIVDSVDESVERIGASLTHGQNPQDGRPAEMRVVDPWGNNFDLSARGYFGRDETRLPAVRQVVVQADHPDQVAEFYRSRLDLNEVGRDPDGSVVLGDGLIRFSIVQEGLTNKPGIQYIGIQVDDWNAMADRFKAMGQTLPAPKDGNDEVLLRDPAGNLVILSQKGWEA